MSPRATPVLLGVLVVLGAVAFVVQGPCSADRPREHGALLPGLAPADVVQVRIARPGVPEVLLAREGGAWKLGAAKEAADGDGVEALLKGLAEARVAALVSTNVAKQEAYETDGAKGIAVRLEGSGGKSLAAFVVGKRGPDFASSYARHEGKSEVLLVAPDLRTPLARADWKQDRAPGSPARP